MEPRRRPERAAVLKRRIGRALGAALSLALSAHALDAQPVRRVSPDPAGGTGEPPLGTATVPAVPLPGRFADPDKLAEARSLFAVAPVETRLGGYRLLTDVDDDALLASMAGVVDRIEPLYRARYGLDLLGEPAETIVLYRTKDAYRILQGRSERIRGLPSRGHVGWGLVVLYAGEGGATGGPVLTSVLRHELAHVLSRRGLGPALPPWLDEGLADDLAAHDLSLARDPREVPLDSMRIVDGNQVEIRGALANLDLLAKALASGTAPALETILAYDWASFMKEPQAQLHYAASGWLIRFLLDERSGLADEFHGFLDQVARGARGEPADLEAALGRRCSAIESGWRAYVAWRALGAGVGPRADASSE